MKPFFITAAALGCVTLAGFSAYADPGFSSSRGPIVPVADSGDGAGLPGLPGGRAGKSGRDLARETAGGQQTGSDDPHLVEYCTELLRTNGNAPSSDDFEPSDCSAYFAALGAGSPDSHVGQDGEPGQTGSAGRRGSDGRDGASIDGGVGGQGGRAGSGPGGGSGGSGGAGIGGGSGGSGGRGGNSY